MINFKTFLITEGGAAGRMKHPYELPYIKTGDQLVAFFNKAFSILKKQNSSIKIDGINVSLKLVNVGEPEKPRYEFALTRGSMKPMDVKGITKQELPQYFTPGHGLIAAASETLSIMNASISSIMPELKKLGFFSDPDLFFNTEYVKDKINVQNYNYNFLAIHGVNKFYQVTPRRRESTEVLYDKTALKTLIEKVNEIAKNHNFVVYGDVPASLKGTPNFNKVLNQPFIVIKDGVTYNEPLINYLKKAKNPFNKKILLKNGKSVSPLSTEVYNNIAKGVPVEDFVASSKDYTTAVDGASIFEATKNLGTELLNCINSDLGKGTENEGIVIRNQTLSPDPIKITGEFMTRKNETPFRKGEEDNEGDEGFNIDTPNRPANTRLPPRSTFSNPPYEPGDNGMSMTPKPYGPTEALVTSSKLKLFNELTNMVVGNHTPFNKKIIVLYPGRFQPFSKHHEQVFQKLKAKFPQAKVYLATSDRPAKFDPAKHFLNFDEKLMTAVASGIDPNDVIKTANPYQAPEIVNRFPKQDTILILAVGDKDMKEDPRFSFKPKKNGESSYFQPFKNVDKCESLDKHAYILSMPVEKFTLMGKNIENASVIRDMYRKGDENTRKQIVTDLYGKYLPNIKKIFDEKLA